MLENLEEAIVVTRKSEITFNNSLFDKVLQGVNKESILSQQIFKVYRKNESDDTVKKDDSQILEESAASKRSKRSIRSKSKEKFGSNGIYSINELI
jgi:hypothetical protein